MKFEIVDLNEKLVAGLKIRTSNQSETMQAEIGALWQTFYGGVFESIPSPVTGRGIGLYTNYASDASGEYDMLACCEVGPQSRLPEGIDTAVIPAGRYAKFVLHGDVQKDVAAFWAELWDMQLDRKFTADFEEYIVGDDQSNAEIHVFIALN